MTQRRWGYKPDPVDGRDLSLTALLGALSASPPPASASVEHPLVGPKDQGSSGSCTGMAWAQAVRLAYLRKGIDCPELSALHAYYANRAEFGGQRLDDGAYLRTGAAALIKFGIATEEAWPFDERKVNVEPTLSAFHSAMDRRGMRGYHRVDLGNADDVRRAIAAGLPVVGGWQVDEAFADYDGIGVIGAPDPRHILGGHAICLTAYAADGTFRFLNSWGSTYGISGFGVADESFIVTGGDGWVVDVTSQA